MSTEEIRAELLQLQQEGRIRQLVEAQRTPKGALNFKGRTLVDFTSWDLLGLARHPQILKVAHRALLAQGASACAARTSSGCYAQHLAFEQRIARFFRAEASLTFSSRNQALLSLVAAIANERDLLLVDELYQGPVVDAGYLVGAQVETLSLRRLTQVKEAFGKAKGRRRVIVFADYLSPILGDLIKTDELLPVLTAAGAWLILDECAALGTVGALGAGSSEVFAKDGLITPTVLVARLVDLSMALCSFGGCIVTSAALRDLILQRSRALSSEVSLPPALLACAEQALDLLEVQPLTRAHLLSLASRLRDGLAHMKCRVQPGESPIVSFEVPSVAIGKEIVDAVLRKGFLFELLQVNTPLHSRAMIRALVNCGHTEECIGHALQALDEVVGRMPVEARSSI